MDDLPTMKYNKIQEHLIRFTNRIAGKPRHVFQGRVSQISRQILWIIHEDLV
jgi:hypothetical protein